jgi:hypothetical protein
LKGSTVEAKRYQRIRYNGLTVFVGFSSLDMAMG